MQIKYFSLSGVQPPFFECSFDFMKEDINTVFTQYYGVSEMSGKCLILNDKKAMDLIRVNSVMKRKVDYLRFYTLSKLKEGHPFALSIVKTIHESGALSEDGDFTMESEFFGMLPTFAKKMFIQLDFL